MASPDLLPHAPASPPDLPAAAPSRRSRLTRLLPEVAALAVVAALWPVTGSLESSAGGPGPGFFPRVLLAVLGVSALIGLAREVVRRRPGRSASTSVALEDDGGPTDVRRALFAAGLVLGYVAATALVGFVLASTVFVATFLWLSGHRSWWRLVAVAGVAPLVLAYVFVKVVYIALPTGLGPFDAVTVALYAVFGIY
jgi:putative tricarboxylic transport membrane protein